MRILWLGLTLAGSLLSMTTVAGAQEAGPGPPVLHANTRLVQVSVVVRDGHGNPIANLKKDDFAIFDEGRPQRVAFFGSEAPSSHTPVAPGRLPPNFFTNRFDLKGQDPGEVTIVLFDLLNTPFEDQSWVRGQVIRVLQHVRPEDHVALYGLNTELIVLQDFTQDSSALVDAVSRFTPKELAAYDASHPGVFDVPALHNDPAWMKFQKRVNEANQMVSDQYKINRVNATIAAIESIANHVASIPGRKNLVWVTGGFPVEIGIGVIAPDRDTRLLYPSEAAKALSSVSMAIYPIDAHGIENPGMGPSLQSPGKADEAFFSRQSNRDSFRSLADATGGKAFYGTNDVAGAARQAFDDGRYAYTLGFYPDHGQWNGKYRKLKITLKAQAAQVRYRKGYFAYPDRAASDETIKAELQETAASPLEATTLAMLVSVKLEPPVEKHNLDLRVEMDPKQFLLSAAEGHETGALDMYYLQRDAQGKILAADKHRLRLNFEEKQYESLAKTGIIFESHLAVRPETSEVRIVVRDSGSGAMGSVTVPASAFASTVQSAK
jgi:VWFA-related protein